ncbi:MAG: GAF domain-containing protein, partial [Actinobacteria bacterium]|nr:GAF domain-containing protein [Actinomycetota bacterium]
MPTELKQAIHELEPGTDVGPFGLSSVGERVAIDDVMRDPTFQAYYHEALAGGVRSCWTEPVRGSDGRVIGVVAFVGRDAATPSPGEQEL